MAKPTSRRRRKKAFQRGVAYTVSVAVAGAIDLTLFGGRRAVTRTLKAGEAQLLAHLLTQKQSQSDGLEGAHGWTPYTPSGAFRRRVVRCHQDNPMDLGSPSKLSAVTAAKHQAPLCKGSWVSCPRLSDSAAKSVCSDCGAVVVASISPELRSEEALLLASSRSPESPIPNEATAAFGTGRLSGRPDLDLNLDATAIANAPPALHAQDALLLADIETRLTREVRGLVAALHKFGSRAQLMGKEIPESAKFCKSVTLLLTLLSFQLAYSFGKDLDTPIFFDDGAEYLRKLNLSLSDFVRELTLDGRRFLAVALVDQQLGQFSSTAERGDEC
jgi:hypothetical protein